MTTQLLDSLKKIIRPLTVVSMAWVLLGAAPLSYSASSLSSDTKATPGSNAAPVRAGEVSLVLGRAYLESATQSRQRIKTGTEINVTDRIVTESNGHVHVRFVDNALMSVRPHSMLEVLSYDFNPEKPEDSLVKFNLLEGVTRAISGQAAKSARDRFRLNTPIAAIGVRGTDFVVSVTGGTVRALVNEGTIVMAPYSAQCSSDSFGPCAVNAVELAGNSLQIMELDSGTEAPRLLAESLAQDPDTVLSAEAQLALSLPEDEVDKPVSKAVYLEGVTSTQAAAESEEAAVILVAASIPDVTPAAALAINEADDSQLIWGRFSAGLGDLERITLSFAEAATAGRESTVGNSTYTLFRPENGSKRVDKGLGVVSFSLNSAQAFYNSESGVVAMQVTGGNLGIDFQENNFATELNLNHDATGAIDFVASGKLFDGGYFHSRDDLQRIAGSVSIDGSEAGYLFERQLEEGGIQGLTLWNSQ